MAQLESVVNSQRLCDQVLEESEYIRAKRPSLERGPWHFPQRGSETKTKTLSAGETILLIFSWKLCGRRTVAWTAAAWNDDKYDWYIICIVHRIAYRTQSTTWILLNARRCANNHQTPSNNILINGYEGKHRTEDITHPTPPPLQL